MPRGAPTPISNPPNQNSHFISTKLSPRSPTRRRHDGSPCRSTSVMRSCSSPSHPRRTLLMPLTHDQRSVLWDSGGRPVRGLYVLSARPGTGKTTTLADYCIEVVTRWRSTPQPWQGLAVVSYTNVAKDELELKIRRLGKANILLKAPHFVGTLDAFVNQELFLPFGAPIMR